MAPTIARYTRSRRAARIAARCLAVLGLGTPLAATAGAPASTASAPLLGPEARGFLDQGREYARHEQWQAAIALYKNALDINPALADAHFLLGVAYHQHREPRKAVAALRRAGELNPASARTFYNLGVAYAHTGEMAKEIAAYHQAIRIDPNHISAHYNLATAYWAQGRDGMACGELYQAGRLYKEAGYTDQAREMLYLIQRIAPDSAYREQLAQVIRE
ncbi:MAG TPA: tetratricopeptide repeat protein [Gammaproteobacteria bacterium]|nr:tetratricopeptide repeat protein [Gammaproteobacteria bacterium]